MNSTDVKHNLNLEVWSLSSRGPMATSETANQRPSHLLEEVQSLAAIDSGSARINTYTVCINLVKELEELKLDATQLVRGEIALTMGTGLGSRGFGTCQQMAFKTLEKIIQRATEMKNEMERSQSTFPGECCG